MGVNIHSIWQSSHLSIPWQLLEMKKKKRLKIKSVRK